MIHRRRFEYELKFIAPKDAQGNHSEACRKRLMEAISKTEEGLARIGQANLRADRYLDRHAVAQGEKEPDAVDTALILHGKADKKESMAGLADRVSIACQARMLQGGIP